MTGIDRWHAPELQCWPGARYVYSRHYKNLEKKTQQQLNESDVATDVSVFLPIDKNKIWGIVNMRPQIAYKTSFVNHNYIFNPVAKTWLIILNIRMCPPPH